MSTRAIEKQMVLNCVEEIALLKKGEITQANKLLIARINCMDKLWVIMNFDTPGNEELIKYLWEQVKELTLLLTDASNKEEITCLGDYPVLDTDPVSCPYIPLSFKIDVTIDYIGGTDTNDGLGGSFDFDSDTYLIPLFVKLHLEQFIVQPGTYPFDFNNTIFFKDGDETPFKLEYSIDGGPPVEVGINAFNVVITDADVTIDVTLTEVIPVTHPLTVNYSYIGGTDPQDGLLGTYDMGAFEKVIDNFVKSGSDVENFLADTINLDFSDTLFAKDGVVKDHTIEKREDGGSWVSTTPAFSVDVPAVSVVDVRFTELIAFYDLTVTLTWLGSLGPNDGYGGSYDINLTTKAITLYDKGPIVDIYNLQEGNQVLDLNGVLGFVNTLQVDIDLEYSIDAGPWTPVDVSKVLNVSLTADSDVQVRASVVPQPQYNLNLDISWVGGADANDGLGGSYEVDGDISVITQYSQSWTEVKLLDVGSYVLDLTNILAFESGVSESYTLEFSLDGGPYNPVVGTTIPFDIVAANVTIDVRTTVVVPVVYYTFDVKYGHLTAEACTGTPATVYAAVPSPNVGDVIYKDTALTIPWDELFGGSMVFVTPSVHGDYVAILDVVTNKGEILSISGYDCSPDPVVSLSYNVQYDDMGAVTAGDDSVCNQITLTHTGNSGVITGTVTITQAGGAGDWCLHDNSGCSGTCESSEAFTLNPGESEVLSLQYNSDPGDTGQINETITITHDAPNIGSPINVGVYVTVNP